MVLYHRLFQRWETCGKEWIVVLSLHINILLISFVDAACHDKLQEFYCCLFAGLVLFSIVMISPLLDCHLLDEIDTEKSIRSPGVGFKYPKLLQFNVLGIDILKQS